MTTDVDSSRLLRSVLFVPAVNARALAKARTLDADALIVDLEDAVLPDQKTAARASAEAALTGGWVRPLALRINGLDTPWGAEDVALASRLPIVAVVLPKVEDPGALRELSSALDRAGARDDLRLWAMIETPRGVLGLEAIAAATSRLEALVLGSNDLTRSLGALATAGREALQFSLGRLILVARALGLVALDGVHPGLDDPSGLEAACRQARALGFDGKTLIHPQEIAIANRCFAPSEADVATAERTITAFEAAARAGKGVAVVDGKLVEPLHVDQARALLNRARLVRERNN